MHLANEVLDMMELFGSKKQDFKTRDRSVGVALDWHKKRTDELIKTGIEKTVASKQAYTEFINLSKKELNKLHKTWKETRW